MKHLIVLALVLVLAQCSKAPTEADYAALEWKNDVYLLDGTPFTGIARATYDDGSPKGEYPFTDGRFHGLVREWWPNGEQRVETSFENSQRDGVNRYWSDSGTLTKEQVYDHDHSTSVKTFKEE